jgi:hypothetical protein
LLHNEVFYSSWKKKLLFVLSDPQKNPPGVLARRDLFPLPLICRLPDEFLNPSVPPVGVIPGDLRSRAVSEDLNKYASI